MKYDPKEIEKKWQDNWLESKADSIDYSDTEKEKYYVLDMLPYPSSTGLHMGHVENYAITDIVYRYKKMRGYNVLHPQAFDSFGLPAENYAVKTGVHPSITVKEAGENYISQMRSLGCGYDFEKSFYTSDPEYYKWTQWLFLKFYENDLVYRKTDTVNWCESCKTVIANEQVVDGKCERCKNEIIQKAIPTWSFKITDFADELIHGEDSVIDWPEHTKKNQNAWIGKSEGSEINFSFKDTDLSTDVFTTRADTLFGATFLVLAPENNLVQDLMSQMSNTEEVKAYIETTSKKTELERLENKEKTGVKLEGVLAINPINGAEIPVFISDYVLASYGTGAIMAVPAHDERDFEFAQNFEIEITPVIDNGFDGVAATTESGTLINSADFDGKEIEDAKRSITEKVGGTIKSQYRLRDWSISRQRYWGAPIPIVYDPEGNAHPVPEEHLPWQLPTDVDFVPTGVAPLAKSQELIERTEAIFGEGWRPETDTMDTFVCSSWYFLRYADPQNSDMWGSADAVKHWQPVDLYIGGAEHTYMHLLYARFWVKAMKRVGLIDFDEPFMKLRHQGYVLDANGVKMSKSLGNVINPDDIVGRFGADAVRLYVMFAGQVEDEIQFNENGCVGMYRFIEKVWRQQDKLTNDSVSDFQKTMHKTIAKVTDDLERMRFNTAISAMMVCVNEMDKSDQVNKDDYQALLKLLSPFAPHVAQELFGVLGREDYISASSWPEFDPELAQDDEVTLGVQINGKMRGNITVPADCSQEDAESMAKQDEGIAKWLEGTVQKVIFVPGRILNFIVN